MKTSKIASLPRNIREELNCRVERSEKTRVTLQWVNAIPEVQAILKENFEGEPIKQQNLFDWKTSPGYSAWKLTQTALAFTEDSFPDDLPQSTLEKMSAKLIRCLQIRYAAVASALPPVHDNPELELSPLGALSNSQAPLPRQRAPPPQTIPHLFGAGKSFLAGHKPRRPRGNPPPPSRP